jgi:hypothetical protein
VIVFRRRIGWLGRRAEEITRALQEFDDRGDLMAVEPESLLDLAQLLDGANRTCWEILEEHEGQAPSAFWFHLSVWTGVGGIALVDPNLISIIITVGGLLGSIKSIYDRGAHLVTEQRYLRLFWAVELRKDKLKSTLARRGIQ